MLRGHQSLWGEVDASCCDLLICHRLSRKPRFFYIIVIPKADQLDLSTALKTESLLQAWPEWMHLSGLADVALVPSYSPETRACHNCLFRAAFIFHLAK